MRLLLETRTLIWLLDDPSQVSPAAMAAIKPLTNDVLLSAATVWELSIRREGDADLFYFVAGQPP